MKSNVETALEIKPLIGILRHLHPSNAREVGLALQDEGFRALEVPLNDEERALECIEILAANARPGVVIGGGTVTTAQQAERIHQAGGTFIVSPDTNAEVIEATARLGMFSAPGASTPTEVFAAVRHGADIVKIFPAASMGPAGLRAISEVLPSTVRLFPVGGVTPDNVGDWRAAGAAGIGIGSALFREQYTLNEIRERARAFAHAWSLTSARG
ncbi:MAG: 2-dehydro-3-deoxy-6-phosphogalactonate aldolase [Rhodoglobus sp.]